MVQLSKMNFSMKSKYCNVKNNKGVSVLALLLFFTFLFIALPNLVNAQILVSMDTDAPVDTSNINISKYQYTKIIGEISESGKIIKYYDGHYVTNVNGRISISNPSDHDLYSIRIPFERDASLYMLELTNTGYLFYNSIEIPILSPHQTINIDYQFIGLTLSRPNDDNVTILNTAIQRNKIRMYTDVQLKLEKGPLENQTGIWRRLISVNIMNPSIFVVKAVNIKLIKTEPGVMDVNNQSRLWRFFDTLLIPRTMMVADVFDYTNVASDIYWISADTAVANFELSARSLINHFTEKDIDNQAEIQLAEDIISQQGPTEKPFDQMLLVQKFVSDTLIKTDQVITVKNLIYNFEDKMKTVSLKDVIPKNFELIEVITDEERTPVIISGENLSWNDIMINPHSGRIFTYTMKMNNPNASGIQYIDGSTISFEEGRITSSNIPVILQFLPEKKLFMQKKVSILSDDEYLVDIEIKNLGDTVNNLVLRDNIPEDKTISEITKPFLKRGVWNIEMINDKDSWKLTYVTNDAASLQNIPLLFGIEQDAVFITLTVDNQIKTGFINKIQASEVIGIALLCITLLFYAISITRRKERKKKQK